MTAAIDKVWQQMQHLGEQVRADEPLLSETLISLKASSFVEGAAIRLASLVADELVTQTQLERLFIRANDEATQQAMVQDLLSCYERDPACKSYLTPWLYFKGYHALQLYRLAHNLYRSGRESVAVWVQHQVARRMGVDIHPNAELGVGIMIDHATGVVIGETAVIGNNVSILHSVTLGGSGLDRGQRHPRVGNDVLISTGAKLLGDITVGDGAKVGAGSLVTSSVAAHTTVAGVPAKVVGATKQRCPAQDMDHSLECKSDKC